MKIAGEDVMRWCRELNELHVTLQRDQAAYLHLAKNINAAFELGFSVEEKAHELARCMAAKAVPLPPGRSKYEPKPDWRGNE